MCRGADPESKGKIESVVKYIKGNYLENRLYVDDSILSYGCLEWIERTANAKIHGTTKRIPREVFACEREYLRPLVDCVENKQTVICRTVRKDNTVLYDSNRYSHLTPMNDRHDCFKMMARKMQNNPMIHGASGPSEHFVYLVDKIFEEYEPDVSMFIGHIGCKHTWASAKIVTDMIQEKYGLPSLYLDVDGIDGLYKSLDEIKGSVGQYMDTVVNK